MLIRKPFNQGKGSICIFSIVNGFSFSVIDMNSASTTYKVHLLGIDQHGDRDIRTNCIYSLFIVLHFVVIKKEKMNHLQ